MTAGGANQVAKPETRPREACRGGPGKPLLVCDWERALMIHYAIDPAVLQPHVPFELDTRDGQAFVSLVAFTMRDMRLRRGGRLTHWLTIPIATHGYLNVRTYVRVGRERGIQFLTEWMPNKLSLAMAPATFGLPYRYGHLDFHHRHEEGYAYGTVTPGDRTAALHYHATFDKDAGFAPPVNGSLAEFLMERYMAFNDAGVRRKFRVWHPSWPQVPARVRVTDNGLLARSGPWFAKLELIGANYSPGFRNVGLGRPEKLE
ncbi:MAG: DUF2071 domain-containing protein [Verrucomicrobia bacterium]|nr:DUF2071 domain-containing protein [Verrucomicrobiota bacterium]MDA1087734.1 DUF2071 domain-containing protein [Verrucomicrobiota bacterium]